MVRLLKFVVYLCFFGFIGVAGYAIIGPYFGADFSAPQTEMRVPVILNAD
jgi:hypothetical protein